MKFKIDAGPFLKAIMPVLEAADGPIERYNHQQLAGVNAKLVGHCEEIVKKGIESALESVDSKPSKTVVSEVCRNACTSIRKEICPVRRITIIASENKVVAVAAGGAITAQSTISKGNLRGMGYRCQQEGKLTVQAPYLKKLLMHVKSWGRVVIADDGFLSGIISPDSEADLKRQFPLLSYHVENTIPSDLNDFAVVDREILYRAIRNVLFALPNNLPWESHRHLLLRICRDKICCIAGDGRLFAACEIDDSSIDAARKKPIEILFRKEDIVILIKALTEMSGADVTMSGKYRSKKDWQIVFENDGAFISAHVRTNWGKYPPVAECMEYDYKYKLLTSLSDWSLIVGRKVDPAIIKRYPIAKIEADIRTGRLLARHDYNFASQTPIPFEYASAVRYSDLGAGGKDDLLLVLFVRRICEMIKRGRPTDRIRISFGANGPLPKKSKTKMDSIKKLVKVKYPARKIRRCGATEQLSILIVNHSKSPKDSGDE